ncbi:MAG: HupE/UreJ family protein [Pseudomonadota bacterium]
MSMASTLGQAGHAHEIRPAIADVEVTGTHVTISISMTLESLAAGINLDGLDNTNNAPETALYDRFRAMSPVAFEAAFRDAWPRISRGFVIETAGERIKPEIVSVAVPAVGNAELPRDSILVISAELPEGDDPVIVGWQASYGTLVLRQIGGGENAYEAFLTSGDLSDPLPRSEIAQESGLSVFLRYIVVGFEHIVPLGVDHILFVLGLFFFSPNIRPLLWQVSAFTLAHTATLALASIGVVSVPAHIVEPLIAASIVYVGVENALNLGNTRLRTAIVFGFGLLHGLGFASALGDFGIASGRFVQALIGFNIGVELGQLAVIAIAFLSVGYWFSTTTWYRKAIAVPVSVVISAIGLYWVIERTGLAPLPPLPI